MRSPQSQSHSMLLWLRALAAYPEVEIQWVYKLRYVARLRGVKNLRFKTIGFPMSEFFIILISTILVNNFVLVQFLGLCPFMGVSNKLETAIGMGGATTFVLTLASICSYWVHTYILEPLSLTYLKTIAFILVIAVVVQFAKLFIEKTSPLLYRVLGVFLPLITSNCAVLGVALQNTAKAHNFFESSLFGFGAAVGFSLVLILFSAMRERLAAADVPTPFRGAAIGMITAGLMSLAFMGFAGLV